jgi:hypothetical protein
VLRRDPTLTFLSRLYFHGRRSRRHDQIERGRSHNLHDRAWRQLQLASMRRYVESAAACYVTAQQSPKTFKKGKALRLY